MKNTYTLILMLCLIACAVAPARATLIVEDVVPTSAGNYVSSDWTKSVARIYPQYPEDTIGFSEAWGGISSNALYVNTANLTISGLENNLGGSFAFASTGNAVTRSDNRKLSSYSVSVSTLWIGMAFSVNELYLDNASSNSAVIVSFNTGYIASGSQWGDTATGYSGQTLGGLGLGVVDDTLVVRYQSDYSATGSIITQSLNISLTADVSYYLVASLSVSSTGDDVLGIWVLTSVPDSESELGEATLVISDADILDDINSISYLNMSIRTVDSGSGIGVDLEPTVYADAIRMGTDYASIIPEPAITASFLGMLCLGFVSLRARRR